MDCKASMIISLLLLISLPYKAAGAGKPKLFPLCCLVINAPLYDTHTCMPMLTTRKLPAFRKVIAELHKISNLEIDIRGDPAVFYMYEICHTAGITFQLPYEETFWGLKLNIKLLPHISDVLQEPYYFDLILCTQWIFFTYFLKILILYSKLPKPDFTQMFIVFNKIGFFNWLYVYFL